MASRDDAAINNLLMELHALDSKMKVVAQRMKVIEKNEQIIGKTLITHNKKLKDIEKMKGSSAPAPSASKGELRLLIDEFKKTSLEVHNTIDSFRKEIQKNKKIISKLQSDIKEIRYVLDTINPVAYATIDQVEDLIKEKVDREMKKKKRRRIT